MTTIDEILFPVSTQRAQLDADLAHLDALIAASEQAADSPGGDECTCSSAKFSGNERYELVTITLLRTVQLPRFTLRAGETWDLRRKRIRDDGIIEIGRGQLRPGDYHVTGSVWLLTDAAKFARGVKATSNVVR